MKKFVASINFNPKKIDLQVPLPGSLKEIESRLNSAVVYNLQKMQSTVIQEVLDFIGKSKCCSATADDYIDDEPQSRQSPPEEMADGVCSIPLQSQQQEYRASANEDNLIESVIGI